MNLYESLDNHRTAFFTTVRIETIATGGIHGSGTGFFFKYSRASVDYLFIVTNKHVVLNAEKIVLTFLREENNFPILGNGYRLTIEEIQNNIWFGHPSPNIDIAVCPLNPIIKHMRQSDGFTPFLRTIDTNIIPDEQQLENFDAIEQVTFIGYPNGIWDSENLLPIARRGTSASPIEIDFAGTPKFFIDASVFGGSSGNPVFITNSGSYSDKYGGLIVGSRLYFVGVIAAVFYRTQLNKILALPIPTQLQHMAEQMEMIDLGIVFKARTVVETVEAWLTAGSPASSQSVSLDSHV